MKETELMNGTIDVIWNGYSKTSERMKKSLFQIRILQTTRCSWQRKRTSKMEQTWKTRRLAFKASSGYDCYVGYPDLLKSMLAKRFNMIRSTMLFWILMPKESRESWLMKYMRHTLYHIKAILWAIMKFPSAILKKNLRLESERAIKNSDWKSIVRSKSWKRTVRLKN